MTDENPRRAYGPVMDGPWEFMGEKHDYPTPSGGPLAYRGKAGCRSVVCSQLQGKDRCYGWHCGVCDAPCSEQGHACSLRGEGSA